MESKVFENNYNAGRIGIFWDLHSCPLSNPSKYSSIRRNITAVLKQLHFRGASEFFAVSDKPRLNTPMEDSFRDQNITFIEARQKFDGTKNTTEKQIIVSMMKWVYQFLSKNNEGGVVLVMTGDMDLRFAIEEMNAKNFRMVVVHNKSRYGVDHRLLNEHAFHVTFLQNVLRGGA